MAVLFVYADSADAVSLVLLVTCAVVKVQQPAPQHCQIKATLPHTYEKTGRAAHRYGTCDGAQPNVIPKLQLVPDKTSIKCS